MSISSSSDRGGLVLVLLECCNVLEKVDRSFGVGAGSNSVELDGSLVRLNDVVARVIIPIDVVISANGVVLQEEQNQQRDAVLLHDSGKDMRAGDKLVHIHPVLL